MEGFVNESRMRNCWRIAFVAYGILSLSFMAGMGIGSGLLALTSVAFLASTWKQSGRATLREAFATPYLRLSFILFAACLLSLLAAMVFPVEGSQEGPMLSSLKKFHYFILPPLVAMAFLGSAGKMEDHPFWKAWAGMGALMGVLSICQFFGRDLFPEPWLASKFFRVMGDTGRFHGQGLMFFHLSFASCMCFVASAAWARLVFPRRGDQSRTLAFWAVVALLASFGVYFTYSRVAFFALALVLLVMAFMKRPILALVVSLLMVLTGMALWHGSQSFQERWVAAQGSNLERIAMWKSAWYMFESRPLTGVGFSRTGEISPWVVNNIVKKHTWFTSHAHNNVLDMLGATGAIGFLAFAAWWGFLFWVVLRAYRRSPNEERWLPAAALTGFLTFHINGLTQVNFWDGKSEHTLMIWVGVVVALWIREHQGQKA